MVNKEFTPVQRLHQWQHRIQLEVRPRLASYIASCAAADRV